MLSSQQFSYDRYDEPNLATEPDKLTSWIPKKKKFKYDAIKRNIEKVSPPRSNQDLYLVNEHSDASYKSSVSHKIAERNSPKNIEIIKSELES